MIEGREGRLAAARNRPRSIRQLRRLANGPRTVQPARAIPAPSASGRPQPWMTTIDPRKEGQ